MTTVKAFCFDAKLDRKIYRSFGSEVGMGLTSLIHGGPFSTKEKAEAEAPKVGATFLSDSWRDGYAVAKVVSVEVRSFDRKVS